MTIHIKSSGFGYLKGSLHKFKNEGKHNYDDFTWDEVFLVVDELSDTFGIKIRDLPLINLEWGINVETKIPPKQILSGLVMHHGCRFDKMYVNPGTHYVCSHSQFRVKAYDKGVQNCLAKNLLRIEISANRSKFINKLGVYKIGDLKRPEARLKLQNALLYGGWANTLLIDPGLIGYNPSNQDEIIRISRWSNPNFWINASKQVRSYHKRVYDRFINEAGFNVKQAIFEAMMKKLWSI
ncbi:hypothetical protein [Algoriphagus sanaruensis]|nr:hypothetical protein [Algoriphagus sanaruensis]